MRSWEKARKASIDLTQNLLLLLPRRKCTTVHLDMFQTFCAWASSSPPLLLLGLRLDSED